LLAAKLLFSGFLIGCQEEEKKLKEHTAKEEKEEGEKLLCRTFGETREREKGGDAKKEELR